MLSAEEERDAALAVIERALDLADSRADMGARWNKMRDVLATVDTSALAARDAELIAERDAALAVIAEVREALAPGRPVYASLGAARAALEKAANRA